MERLETCHKLGCSGKEATICQAFVDAKIPPSGTSADMVAYFIGSYDKAIQFLDTKPFAREAASEWKMFDPLMHQL